MNPYTRSMSSDIAGAFLLNQRRRSDVFNAINHHLVAVQTDEVQFDDAGVAVDEAAAADTRKAEIKNFSDFPRAPCRTAEDVQAKIRYLLPRTIGERDDLVSCIYHEGYGFGEDMECVRLPLRSLLLGEGA